MKEDDLVERKPVVLRWGGSMADADLAFDDFLNETFEDHSVGFELKPNPITFSERRIVCGCCHGVRGEMADGK